jgi:hypothetical protein
MLPCFFHNSSSGTQLHTRMMLETAGGTGSVHETSALSETVA